jgi:cell division septum initiation protein DivIVA
LVQQISLKDSELAAIQQENSNLVREIAGLKTRLKNAQETGSSSDIRVNLPLTTKTL